MFEIKEQLDSALIRRLVWRERRRKQRLKNPEKIREQKRKSWYKNWAKNKAKLKAWRTANPEAVKKNNIKARQIIKERRIQHMQYKATHPCVDCNQLFPPYVMDFDHRDPAQKAGCVGRFVVSASKKRLQLEMAKCDLVCANCHRIRTFKNKTIFEDRC